MPGAIARAGLADEVIALPYLGGKIRETVERYGALPMLTRRVA